MKHLFNKHDQLTHTGLEGSLYEVIETPDTCTRDGEPYYNLRLLKPALHASPEKSGGQLRPQSLVEKLWVVAEDEDVPAAV